MIDFLIENDHQIKSKVDKIKMTYFNCRSHCEDHRVETPLLHRRLEPLRLRPCHCLHRRNPHGGPHDGLPRVAHPPQGRPCIQDRQNSQADKGKNCVILHDKSN